MEREMSTDKDLRWWVMVTLMSIVTVGGGFWCTWVSAQIEDVIKLKINVEYIQGDIKEIKDAIKLYIKEN